MINKRAIIAISLLSIVALHGYYSTARAGELETGKGPGLRIPEETDGSSILGFGIIVGMVSILETVRLLKEATNLF